MLKSQLVRRIIEQKPRLRERDVEKLIGAILEAIVAALARGDRVEIRGFGAFSVRSRPARIARNPRSGTVVAVEKKGFPFFKCGKEVRERLKRPTT
jgi:integration host factor subunit beta